MSRDAWARYEKGHTAHYDVVLPGFKYNMMDIQAALGLQQLAPLRRTRAPRAAGDLVDLRRGAGRPAAAASGARARRPGPRAAHLRRPGGRTECGWTRDDLAAALAEEGIGTSVHFRAVHLFSYYAEPIRVPAGHVPERRVRVGPHAVAAALGVDDRGRRRTGRGGRPSPVRTRRTLAVTRARADRRTTPWPEGPVSRRVRPQAGLRPPGARPPARRGARRRADREHARASRGGRRGEAPRRAACRPRRSARCPATRRICSSSTIPTPEQPGRGLTRARRLGLPVASIHDLGLGADGADLVIDGSVRATGRTWSAPRQLLGRRYCVLAVPPDVPARRTAERRDGRATVVVSLGGGPRRTASLRVARAISHRLPGARVLVAAGIAPRERRSRGVGHRLGESPGSTPGGACVSPTLPSSEAESACTSAARRERPRSRSPSWPRSGRPSRRWRVPVRFETAAPWPRCRARPRALAALAAELLARPRERRAVVFARTTPRRRDAGPARRRRADGPFDRAGSARASGRAR